MRQLRLSMQGYGAFARAFRLRLPGAVDRIGHSRSIIRVRTFLLKPLARGQSRR